MKTVSLSGSPRENVGKKDASKVRSEGRVPCVVYGGESQTHFSVDQVAFSKFVFTPDVFRFELEIDGKKVDAILKDLQFDPVTDQVIHADFLEIIEGKAVKMELPVRITGNAIGVRNGGRLATNFRRIKVNGMPADFPDVVSLDITKLRIGQSLRIKDIELPGVSILHNPQSVVVAIKNARGAVDEGEEEDEEGEEEGAEEGAPAAESAE